MSVDLAKKINKIFDEKKEMRSTPAHQSLPNPDLTVWGNLSSCCTEQKSREVYYGLGGSVDDSYGSSKLIYEGSGDNLYVFLFGVHTLVVTIITVLRYQIPISV